MKTRIGLFAAALALAATATGAAAQTNIQVFYDFGSDRNYVTTTIEGFYNDNWGNTYFFVDHDFSSSSGSTYGLGGTYMEITRCLNFWQNTALSPLSLHIEYNGGVYNTYEISNAFLAGVDLFLHSKDMRYRLNLKVLYKWIDYTEDDFRSMVPMQFTAVRGIDNLFGLKGLNFSGFADFWWEDHYLYSDHYGEILPEVSHCIFSTEPQLWYNVGRHFGCENFNIGTEIELSYDFGSARGFWCRPCLGIKWEF